MMGVFGELNWTTILIVGLVLLVYGLDKLVTWKLAQKGIEAAERQVPIEGVTKLLEGFVPLARVGYEATMGELRAKAAMTSSVVDDAALEWLDERTGKRWFREDVAGVIQPFERGGG